MSGPARRVIAGAPVRPVAREAGPPVRTQWDEVAEAAPPVVLDDLGDVVAPAGALGVLARTASGQPAQFRPASHHHDQDVPANQWLIAHGLPFTPAGVQVTGDQGQPVFPRGVFHTPGQTRIEFAYPLAGVADLS